MNDLRIHEKQFEINGKAYILRCNFNVLADMQAYHNGDLMSAINSPATLHTAKEFIAFMLNDYAAEMKWPERYTPFELGRLLGPDPSMVDEVMEILRDVVYPSIAGQAIDDVSKSDTDGQPIASEDVNEKNAMTMQNRRA